MCAWEEKKMYIIQDVILFKNVFLHGTYSIVRTRSWSEAPKIVLFLQIGIARRKDIGLVVVCVGGGADGETYVIWAKTWISTIQGSVVGLSGYNNNHNNNSSCFPPIAYKWSVKLL